MCEDKLLQKLLLNLQCEDANGLCTWSQTSPQHQIVLNEIRLRWPKLSPTNKNAIYNFCQETPLDMNQRATNWNTNDLCFLIKQLIAKPKLMKSDQPINESHYYNWVACAESCDFAAVAKNLENGGRPMDFDTYVEHFGYGQSDADEVVTAEECCDMLDDNTDQELLNFLNSYLRDDPHTD